MKNELDLNKKILDITMLIQKNYPELSKFLLELTITIPDKKNPEIDAENLLEYYNSLKDLVLKYDLEINQKNQRN